MKIELNPINFLIALDPQIALAMSGYQSLQAGAFFRTGFQKASSNGILAGACCLKASIATGSSAMLLCSVWAKFYNSRKT